MTRWAMLYERLTGRAPTSIQIARIEQIRTILTIRDDDSFWYVLVVNEFYVYLIDANIKRLRKFTEDAKIRAEDAAIRHVPTIPQAVEQTWPVFRARLMQPQALVLLGAILAVLVLSNVVTAFTVTTALGRSEAEHSTLMVQDRRAEIDEMRKSINAASTATAIAVRETIAPLVDSSSNGLSMAYRDLPVEDQQRLAADPARTIRMVHVLASLTPDAQTAFIASNDPATQEGTSRQLALAWFSARVTAGNQGASRLVAAYAANNNALAAVLKRLPDGCGLATFNACR